MPISTTSNGHARQPLQLLGPDGNPLAKASQKERLSPLAARNPIQARYDAAQSNEENRRLWQEVDNLSARAANDLRVRHKLRTRARYEISNNSYARGIIRTLANDVIGTGPRLQMMTDDANLNRVVAQFFDEWAAEIGLAEKLRTMVQAKAGDGETFAVLVTNPALSRTLIQLDLRLYEADQITSPFLMLNAPLHDDGITYDRYGNPVEYHVLEDHPGDLVRYRPGQADVWPASRMIHWFRADRPGQLRGVPEITPALPLFALLRRYTLAVLAAAETAADFAAVLYSELPPEADAIEGNPFETLEIERRMMTTLPSGWKMGQFKAEQPTTTYADFKQEILNEIARCLNMPFNVAAGNSAGYNYSSGRLDHQTYFKSINVDQYHCETAVLDRILPFLLQDAADSGLIPDNIQHWPHQWFWDGHEHVDPLKEANAQAIRLRNGTTTLADEHAKNGYDWREKAKQQAEERDYYGLLGIPYPGDAVGGPIAPGNSGERGNDEINNEDDNE